MTKINEDNKIIGSFGYYQKSNRYHWKINNEIKINMGFKSKNDCEEWIKEKYFIYGFEWRVGFMVKFKSEQTPWYLVDKNGTEIKTF